MGNLSLAFEALCPNDMMNPVDDQDESLHFSPESQAALLSRVARIAQNGLDVDDLGSFYGAIFGI